MITKDCWVLIKGVYGTKWEIGDMAEDSTSVICLTSNLELYRRSSFASIAQRGSWLGSLCKQLNWPHTYRPALWSRFQDKNPFTRQWLSPSGSQGDIQVNYWISDKVLFDLNITQTVPNETTVDFIGNGFGSCKRAF